MRKFIEILLRGIILVCIFQEQVAAIAASTDTSLCCETTDYSNIEFLKCINGKDYPTSPISSCATCVAYQCIDWTVGSNLNAIREAQFMAQTRQNVYFGVASYGSNPNGGGICYRITTDSIAKDLIVQIVNYGGDVPAGNVDLQVADGGFGLFDACTQSSTKMPQFNSTAAVWGDIYGGVSTRAACSNLPPYPICGQNPQDSMISLCQFSWDQGFRRPPNVPGQSGNPQIKNICQVACPQQLYMATGLRRVDETNNLYTCNNNLEPTGGYVTKTMDCTKVTYAWPDNVPGITYPGLTTVVPCRRDGYTRVNQMPSTTSPTLAPRTSPTTRPISPSNSPSTSPSSKPTGKPTTAPSAPPTVTPSISPSTLPSSVPTSAPSKSPSLLPTSVPTAAPFNAEKSIPTAISTAAPSIVSAQPAPPVVPPTTTPSQKPTPLPSVFPSVLPSFTPTAEQTLVPQGAPSVIPSASPSVTSTITPTAASSLLPTSSQPTIMPTPLPSSTVPTSLPTTSPSTNQPTRSPSAKPSIVPSRAPSKIPSNAVTALPNRAPTALLTFLPTDPPSTTTMQFTESLSMTLTRGCASLVSDQSSQRALEQTTANSMQVSLSYVTYMGCVDGSSKVNSHVAAATSTSGTSVAASMNILIPLLQSQLTTASQLYNSLQQKIQSSVQSGNFSKALLSSSQALKATATYNATVIVVSASAAAIQYPPSALPTKVPSKTVTASPLSTSSSSLSMQLSLLIGILGGIVVLAMIGSCVAYYILVTRSTIIELPTEVPTPDNAPTEFDSIAIVSEKEQKI